MAPGRAGRQGRRVTDRLHTLYRFFDERDVLLYVGITMDPGRRFKNHRATKAWWSEIERIELEQHPDRDTLALAEREAIKTEKPLHNVAMNGSYRPRDDSLIWACSKCRKPIADGDGHIIVSLTDIYAHQDPYGSFGEAEWTALHSRCDPYPEWTDYRIPIERIRTQAHALHWTAHLLEKKWIRDTNWASVVRLVAGDRLR